MNPLAIYYINTENDIYGNTVSDYLSYINNEIYHFSNELKSRFIHDESITTEIRFTIIVLSEIKNFLSSLNKDLIIKDVLNQVIETLALENIKASSYYEADVKIQNIINHEVVVSKKYYRKISDTTECYKNHHIGKNELEKIYGDYNIANSTIIFLRNAINPQLPIKEYLNLLRK